jgi:hypothetical protein
VVARTGDLRSDSGRVPVSAADRVVLVSPAPDELDSADVLLPVPDALESGEDEDEEPVELAELDDDEDDEDGDEDESPVSANAVGADASATPTPRVTARAPTRPMCLA